MKFIKMCDNAHLVFFSMSMSYKLILLSEKSERTEKNKYFLSLTNIYDDSRLTNWLTVFVKKK